jgi:YHS domain-containing protein
VLFMEVFIPTGILNESGRRQLGQRLIAEVLQGGAPEVVARARAMTQVIVHEGLMTGGHAAGASDPSAYVVRAHMPAGHSNDRMRAELVSRITRVLRELDGNPERADEEPRVWVYLVEVPDGQIGALGTVQRLSDIMQMVLAPGGARTARRVPSAEPAPDTAIDPICGMTVALTDAAITLEHEGTRYVFCCDTCRDLFAEERGVPSS